MSEYLKRLRITLKSMNSMEMIELAEGETQWRS